MKRSEINAVIKEMEAFFAKYNFNLPDFCKWTPEEWQSKGHEYDEIRDNKLGWDVTDYCLGNFSKDGLGLVTIRNGNQHNNKYSKVYAEKAMYMRSGQHSLLHFHWTKTEDIINRAGGTFIIHMYEADRETEEVSDRDVLIHSDGREYYVPAGTGIVLLPGQSLTIMPYQYHDFDVPADSEAVLLGEVSQCNDDDTDNRFIGLAPRFPELIEDEEPYRLLCFEYPEAKD